MARSSSPGTWFHDDIRAPFHPTGFAMPECEETKARVSRVLAYGGDGQPLMIIVKQPTSQETTGSSTVPASFSGPSSVWIAGRSRSGKRIKLLNGLEELLFSVNVEVDHPTYSMPQLDRAVASEWGARLQLVTILALPTRNPAIPFHEWTAVGRDSGVSQVTGVLWNEQLCLSHVSLDLADEKNVLPMKNDSPSQARGWMRSRVGMISKASHELKQLHSCSPRTVFEDTKLFLHESKAHGRKPEAIATSTTNGARRAATTATLSSGQQARTGL
ncbi:hypothetical protein FA95DRAFT_1576768 [Auriscalpium vulgare]|uniref:Uncharacterized protein n=1 Tax=Auriscalpium vulgare TaxID=40419 RepID=A0ACB8RA47_9AGAM|nr:hypothetical protein FA95DRAFT_1576768 [Auriscalpium vulgare]